MTEKVNLTWVVAHEPLHLFLRTANAFKNIIEEQTNGRINVTILTKSEFYNDPNAANRRGFFSDLVNNRFQMAQFQTTALGTKYKNFHIFDLPFLFKDHAHATRVLDGSIGENLLDLLSKNTKVRGLAFTYSGGFRVMVSNSPIKNLEDIKGKTISCSESPIAEEIYNILGANPVLDRSGHDLSVHFDENPDIDFDGGETTLVRFDRVKEKTPYITNTKHSLFLTTIVISNEFWDSLSNEDKELFKDAAKKTALAERQETITDSEAFVDESKSRCAGFFEFTKEEMVKFKEATLEIYSSELLKKLFIPAIVKKIRTA
jgi:TRAP-type C4-dicarboxylate transport system substrate-binding protein